MNIEKKFDFFVAVVFDTIPQLGGIGPKLQVLVFQF